MSLSGIETTNNFTENLQCLDLSETQISGNYISSYTERVEFSLTRCTKDCNLNETEAQQYYKNFGFNVHLIDNQIDFNKYDQKPIAGKHRVISVVRMSEEWSTIVTVDLR